jgi:hypothetical protein
MLQRDGVVMVEMKVLVMVMSRICEQWPVNRAWEREGSGLEAGGGTFFIYDVLLLWTSNVVMGMCCCS